VSFNESFFRQPKSQNQRGKKSIFICGLPRSGTTLVEQILAGHSQVNAGDELFYLGKASKDVITKNNLNVPFPKWANKLSQSQWQQIGQQYLTACKPLAQQRWLTDKMPANYKALGIISQALPDAKIIYCRRNKEDVIWGCYKQILGKGNGFSNNLAHLQKVYDAHTNVMSHFKDLMGKSIFELQYETLVQNPAYVIDQLCDFIGLNFEEKMLGFFQNKQPIHTISSTQVRKPISQQYVNGWKNYQEMLAL